jgi:hypothetical protein
MITIQDFQYASFEEKCEVVTCYSDYLITRESSSCKIYLYYADKFFIEVYYSPTDKKVLAISAFTDTARLCPYVDMISLDDLNR